MSFVAHPLASSTHNLFAYLFGLSLSLSRRRQSAHGIDDEVRSNSLFARKIHSSAMKNILKLFGTKEVEVRRAREIGAAHNRESASASIHI